MWYSDYDYDPPESEQPTGFCKQTTRRAAKDHVCDLCEKPILKGTLYTYYIEGADFEYNPTGKFRTKKYHASDCLFLDLEPITEL
jgi:hypothetical protein